MFRELLHLAIVIAASSEPCDNFSRLVQVFSAFYDRYSDVSFQGLLNLYFGPSPIPVNQMWQHVFCVTVYV
jgi:hypothetical protein